jgi:hypothetical protein
MPLKNHPGELFRRLSAGLEVRDWKCGIGSVGLEVWDWSCGIGGVGLEVWDWRCTLPDVTHYGDLTWQRHKLMDNY